MPFYRDFCFDASPQRSGREIFAACERVVRCSDVDGRALADIDPSRFTNRRLPICGLGQGRTTPPDKVSCLVHQIWLDYGPSASDVRKACRSVRQCLSDMGAEFGVCDYPDVVDEVLAGIAAGCPAAAVPCKSGSSLLPLALERTGTLPIIDGVLQRLACGFQWWPLWNSRAKLIMQFMRA